MITLRIDLDDVLNKFSEYFLDYHYRKTGETLIWDRWDLHNNSRYGFNIWNHLEEPNFFTDIPMELNADKLIEYLDNQHSVFDYKIVSSYYGSKKKVFENIYMQKKSYIYKHFGERAMKKFYLVNGSKSEFPADIVIDDYHNNLIGKELRNSLKFYFRRRHNANIVLDTDYIIDVTNHKSILEVLREIPFHTNIESYLKNKFDV